MALFGELGYQLTERWQVTAGARWFDYDDQLVLETSFPFFDTVLNDSNQTGDNDAIFKFNTSFKITPDVMGYLTSARATAGRPQLAAVPGSHP
jgi:outer membrane receptor protein involved in Fe transport